MLITTSSYSAGNLALLILLLLLPLLLVTGRILGNPNAAYWVRNVREPVLSQQAVEHVFKHDAPPELVIEIGPHRSKFILLPSTA